MNLHTYKIPRPFGGNRSQNGLNCVMSQASCFTFNDCLARRINMKIHQFTGRRLEPTSIFYQSACSPPNTNSLHLFTLLLRVTDLICQCKYIVSRILCTMLKRKAARMAQLVQWLDYKLTVTGIDSHEEVLWFALVSVRLCSQTDPSHTNVVNLRNYLHVLLWFAGPSSRAF
jgi:hypothetical protein